MTLHASYSENPRNFESFSHRNPSDAGYWISPRTSMLGPRPRASRVEPTSPMPSTQRMAASGNGEG
jgi:hypothetical protein